MFRTLVYRPNLSTCCCVPVVVGFHDVCNDGNGEELRASYFYTTYSSSKQLITINLNLVIVIRKQQTLPT